MSVYNVTEYAKDHPGGWEALIEVAGQDATSAFEDVGHSEDAREIMHAYLVGVFEGAVPEAPGALNPSLSSVTRSCDELPLRNLRAGAAACSTRALSLQPSRSPQRDLCIS